jgi:hypothetical protein
MNGDLKTYRLDGDQPRCPAGVIQPNQGAHGVGRLSPKALDGRIAKRTSHPLYDFFPGPGLALRGLIKEAQPPDNLRGAMQGGGHAV